MGRMLRTMRDAWRGEFSGASGPMPALWPWRPRLLFGGFAPAAFDRALGADAITNAAQYICHYYGAEDADQVMADTVTSLDMLDRQLQDLSRAGCDDVVFLPCTAEHEQVDLLAHALRAVGGTLTIEEAA